MSILPTSAQSHLSTSQVAALDRQYSQAASIIAGATAAPAASSGTDSLFISADAQAALVQFEQSGALEAGGDATAAADPAQDATAALLQALDAPTAAPSFGFTSASDEAALLRYEAQAQTKESQDTSGSTAE